MHQESLSSELEEEAFIKKPRSVMEVEAIGLQARLFDTSESADQKIE